MVLFLFKTQLIPDLTNPERIDQAPLAAGLNGGLPIEETGQMVIQQSTGGVQNHASLVQEQDSNLHFEEEFGREIIAVLEDEVLIITIESTPAIVEET